MVDDRRLLKVLTVLVIGLAASNVWTLMSFQNIMSTRSFSNLEDAMMEMAYQGYSLTQTYDMASKESMEYAAVGSTEYLYIIQEWPRRWSCYGSDSGQFNRPVGVAHFLIESAEYVYVTDTENHRVQKFKSDGTFVAKWGSYGDKDGQFYRPAGVAVDKDGLYIYVVDTGNHRVQKFFDEFD